MPTATSQNPPNINEPPTTSTTLREAVKNRITLTLQMDGIDAAKAELKAMAGMFSFVADWPSIYNEVAAYLMQQKRLADQVEAEHKEEIEKVWIGAMAKNGFSGQLNFLTGKDAQAPYYQKPIGGHKE